LLDICSHLLAGQNLILPHTTQLFGILVAQHVTLTRLTENNFSAAGDFEALCDGFFGFIHGEKAEEKIDSATDCKGLIWRIGLWDFGENKQVFL